MGIYDSLIFGEIKSQQDIILDKLLIGLNEKKEAIIRQKFAEIGIDNVEKNSHKITIAHAPNGDQHFMLKRVGKKPLRVVTFKYVYHIETKYPVKGDVSIIYNLEYY